MTAACDTSGTARLADIRLRLPFTSKHWNPHESRLLVLGRLFGLKGNPNMTRYKGRQSAKAIERDFPHIVEMVVPEGGLGKRLDAMYDFHARHGVRARLGLGRRNENGRDIIRWCFADPRLAAAFPKEFDAISKG
jgi:hypothetical protein